MVQNIMTSPGTAKTIILFGASLLVTLAIIFAAAHINDIYYVRQPFQGDTASYFLMRQRIWLEGQTWGQKYALVKNIVENDRTPAAFIPYLFMPSRALLSINSHLVYSAFAVFAFLFSYAVCVWKRTGSLTYAIGVLPLLGTMGGLFDPIYQLPSMLPDPPAALFMGAALFSLLNSQGARRPGWLFLFGVFVAFTATSRFIAAGYVFVVCAPIFLAYLVRLLFLQSTWLALRAVTIVAVPIIVLAGNLMTSTANNLSFYAYAGYGLNQDIAGAIETTGYKFVTGFVGPTGASIVLLLLIVYFTICWRSRNGLKSLSVATWAAISQIVLILLILRVKDDAPQLVYAIPGLLLLAAAPFAAKLPTKPAFGAAIFLALSISSAFQYYAHASSESLLYPRPRQAALKTMGRGLAEHAVATLKSIPGEPCFDAAFDYFGRYLTAYALSSFGSAICYKTIFQIRESQWKLGSRAASSADIDRWMKSDMDQELDALFVLENPASPDAVDLLKDAFTVQLAKNLHDYVSKSPGWKKLAAIDSPYGRIAFFQNEQRRALLANADRLRSDLAQAITAISAELPSLRKTIVFQSLMTPPSAARLAELHLATQPKLVSVDYFPVGLSAWQERFPDGDVQRAQRKVWNLIDTTADVIVIPSEPLSDAGLRTLRDVFTQQQVLSFRDRLAEDPSRWKLAASIENPVVSVQVFQRTSSNSKDPPIADAVAFSLMRWIRQQVSAVVDAIFRRQPA